MANLIIHIEQGQLEGASKTTEKGTKYHSFKGIPYAEPPVGDLRFKAPVEIRPWTGIKQALNEGNCSPQIDTSVGKIIGNEDCLFLNVYTPSITNSQDNKALPVMVFIHGGGFRMGSGNEDNFGPELFVEMETILVTMNYRLGVFGFLCLDIPEVPGNAGLLDQNMALCWVQQNISYFGGDRTNVTIFGVSAGSASVEYHMLSPLSKGLFHKAILESGTVLNPWTRNRKPKELIEKIKKHLKISSDDPCVVFDSIKEMDVDSLLKAAMEIMDDDTKKSCELFGFAPVVEHCFDNVKGFLNSEPIDLLKSGDHFNGPTIFGFCNNEGALFKYFYGRHVKNIVNRKYTDYMASFNLKNENYINEDLTKVYNANEMTDMEQVDEFLSDMMFVSGIYTSLKYRLKQKHTGSTYCYVFSYDGGLKMDFSSLGIKAKGTLHGSETAYLCKLGDIDENKKTVRDDLMRCQMVGMWTNFAKFGNPSIDESSIIKWRPITLEDFSLLEINNESKMVQFPWIDRMKLWEKFYP